MHSGMHACRHACMLVNRIVFESHHVHCRNVSELHVLRMHSFLIGLIWQCNVSCRVLNQSVIEINRHDDTDGASLSGRNAPKGLFSRCLAAFRLGLQCRRHSPHRPNDVAIIYPRTSTTCTNPAAFWDGQYSTTQLRYD